MKNIGTLILLISLSFLGGCQTSTIHTEVNPRRVIVAGPIEITAFSIDRNPVNPCSIHGSFVDERNEPVGFINVKLSDSEFITQTNIDGEFNFENIPMGNYLLQIVQLGLVNCSVEINVESGEQVIFDAILAQNVEVLILKPIIYIYPEEKTEVKVELIYDGEITTTYPKYPENGWTITASPDGTLIDQNEKEYYALYWEGKPRKPLGIEDGFVVSKVGTIPFLEEKLTLLGLNSKEANEFIVFWLPILEKNNFNLIHFAGDDYLTKAELKISPTPKTVIRVAMVFKGLDEEIDFPIQDLTPLYKNRKGFTVVEWGGQELPKQFKFEI